MTTYYYCKNCSYSSDFPFPRCPKCNLIISNYDEIVRDNMINSILVTSFLTSLILIWMTSGFLDVLFHFNPLWLLIFLFIIYFIGLTVLFLFAQLYYENKNIALKNIALGVLLVTWGLPIITLIIFKMEVSVYTLPLIGRPLNYYLWDDPHLYRNWKATTIGAVGIATDGSHIAWGNTSNKKHINGQGALSYQVSLTASGGLGAAPLSVNAVTWRQAETVRGEWSIQHVAAAKILEIRRNGQMQAKIERCSSDDNYNCSHLAYTFTPNGMTIISGGENGVLSSHDRNGNKLGYFVAGDDTSGDVDDITAVAVSGDGRLLVSGSSGSLTPRSVSKVRVWNVVSRELLLTLLHCEDGEWIAWTPQGYYAASSNGSGRAGWQIRLHSWHFGNQFLFYPATTSAWIEASKLSKQMFRPQVLARGIELGSAEKASIEVAPGGVHLNNLLMRAFAQDCALVVYSMLGWTYIGCNRSPSSHY